MKIKCAKVIVAALTAIMFSCDVGVADTRSATFCSRSGGCITLRILSSVKSQEWLCRPLIRDDEGAILEYPSQTNLSALNIVVSTNHDIVFIDDKSVVLSVVRDVPATNDLGGPPSRTSSSLELRKAYNASFVVILNGGRAASAGIQKSEKFLKLTKTAKVNPLPPPCLIEKR